MRLFPFALAAALILALTGCARPTEEAPVAQKEPVAAPPANLPGQKRPEGFVDPAQSTPVPMTSGVAAEISSGADVPLYPGAGEVAAASGKQGERERFEIRMTTPDPIEKVEAFYVEQLKLEASGEAANRQLMGRSPKGRFVIITLKREGEKTKIEARVVSL